MQRLCFDMPLPLYKELKKLAAAEYTSVSALIRSWVLREMKKNV